MNGYYSNEHIYRVSTKVAPSHRPAASRLDRFLDAVYAILAALICVLKDRTVRRVLRYALVAVCAVCFIGLIGGIEQGLLSVGGGIFAGLVLIFIEILCLK